jgi:sirohydrochlorin cobaltochelatase
MNDKVTLDDSDSLILFAHGARDPGWRGPVDALARRLRSVLPGIRVEPAFLERMSPTLIEAIDAAAVAGSRRVVVAPVFWAPGGHLKNDVPALVDEARRRHAGVRFEIWPALGESDAVLDGITRAYAALWKRSGA